MLIISNIFFGSVFGWLWYKTESMPLVGWLHFLFDFSRDVTTLVLIEYGKTLWATHGVLFLFTFFGCWCMFQIGNTEGTSANNFWKHKTE